MLREKILVAVEAAPPELTRREGRAPTISGKAMLVSKKRRSGKTIFLYQRRSELIAERRSPERLVYFNFEDERLAGVDSSRLGLIPESHWRLFPDLSSELVTLFFSMRFNRCLVGRL